MPDSAGDRDPRQGSPEAGDRPADPAPDRGRSDVLPGPPRGRRLVAGAVAVLLVIHGTLVGYSATRHSPTLNEPGHLVAGLIQWRFGRFEVYRVNPPLVHYAAALPVMLAGYRADWDSYENSPAARSEMAMGEDFIRADGEHLLGIDLQEKDFEERNAPSFLPGEWKDGGGWYDYFYGLWAKTTIGLQVLVCLGVLTVLIRGRRDPSRPLAPGLRDLVILAAPGIAVLALVSSHLRFNHHVRYVLPTLGLAMVFAGSVAWWFEPDGTRRVGRRIGRTTRTESVGPA